MSRLDTLIDEVDHQDAVVGRIRRGDALAARANFRVVHILVFNSAGDLLLQKIAPGLRHAGAWGSSVAGYVKSSESYDHAAGRKLQEELGLSAIPLTFLGKTRMQDQGSLKFIAVYDGRYSGPVRVPPDVAEREEFFPFSEVMRLRHSSPGAFTPTFLYVLDFYLRGRGATGP